jgi:hypothetical protein
VAPTDETRELLELTASLAADFLRSLDERPVFPRAPVEELRTALGGPLPEGPLDPAQVVAELARAADDGLVAMSRGRYFGFVIGGAVPAALAADWLTSAWDQNAGPYVGGPAASVAEEVGGGWVRELRGLPETASFGFVTGCQMAGVPTTSSRQSRVPSATRWNGILSSRGAPADFRCTRRSGRSAAAASRGSSSGAARTRGGSRRSSREWTASSS